MMTKKGRVVYSTGPEGRLGVPGPAASSGSAGATAPGGQGIRVRREKAGRGGKTVTVIYGVPPPREEAAALLTRFKRMCGSGGTLKPAAEGAGFDLEIQGDHADRVTAELCSLGYKARRAGG